VTNHYSCRKTVMGRTFYVTDVHYKQRFSFHVITSNPEIISINLIIKIGSSDSYPVYNYRLFFHQ
ncbi:MAG TPA: hypothetical protein PLE24_16060, partial [Chitinispirillaceae bacterium]|nr:hypothetical protein [Chitinispirillaceae bacterium]